MTSQLEPSSRKIFGARVENDAHDLVFVGGGFGDDDVALAAEHPSDRAGFGHVAAVLGHDVANFADRAIAVAGDHGDEYANAAGAVAFKHGFFELLALEAARTAEHGALDVVVGHVFVLRGGDGGAKARVGIRVSAAVAGGDGQLADDFGEGFAALGVGSSLLVLDCGPL